MSDPGGGRREWAFYLEDMIGFSEKVMAYTAALNQDAFLSDDLIYDATLRNLELIGEAATHIPDAVRTTNPQIAWRLIVATRDRLVHAYATLVPSHPVTGAS